MKNFIFQMFFILFFLSSGFTQVNYYYYPMNTGTTNNLYALGNASYQLGLAVGANGTLLRTTGTQNSTNFGVNWVTIPLNTSNDIRGILLYNSGLYYNYIFGNNGTIFSSSGSGNNWILQNSGVNVNLNSASFGPGSDSMWMYRRILIVGNNGIIITKSEAPDSTIWWQIPSGTTNNLKCIFFESQLDYPVGNNNVGWISGTNGTLLKTIDGGLHWSPVYTGFNNDFNAVCFGDTAKGFIVGSSGLVLKTTNRGINWFQVQSGTTQTLNSLSTKYDLVNGSIATVAFAAGQNGTVIRTSNSGLNWFLEPYTPPENINCIKYLYGLKGNYWLTADNGKIYKRNLDTFYHTNEDVTLEANNIRSHFVYRGIFDNDIRTTNTPGFEWPKGSNKFAIFTAGLSIAAKVNGELRQAMGSYKGEYGPGYCNNGNFYTNLYFKIYKVSKSENAQTSWDWANWGQMVPFGAQYIDVNNNNIYEPAIDTPGVRNAKETLFYCMTDGSFSTHDPGEGFGGGTQPLYAEVHMTAWAYDSPGLEDVQFISYEIINKSTSTWTSTYFAIVSDPDMGDAGDDYVGCDTVLRLGYFYNGDNYDNIYGANPPAAGFAFLVSPLNRNIIPNSRLGVTSLHKFYQSSGPPCETDPNGEPLAAYRMLKGYKKDSTCYLDPTYIPPKKIKICYPGDPETNIGWTEVKGSIYNCNRDTTGTIYPGNPNNVKLVMSSGADNFNIVPGESQKFVIAQMIARGSSNLNSVTLLKTLCANVRAFYEQNFPIGINQVSSEVPREFKLMQNYPNPFNPNTIIRFQIKDSRLVTLKIYDILGKEVTTLVNEQKLPGVYEIAFDGSGLASGIYFYKLFAGDFSQTRKMVLLK